MGARETRAERAIVQAWPGKFGRRVLATIRELDSFGALAWYLDQADRDGQDPVELLRAIGRDSVTWSIEEADDPGAFLASRIRDR